MKKFKIGLVLFLLCLLPIPVQASDVTSKLYQDITIQEDGSILIKEIAVLEGEYNGRTRTINYRGTNANSFTGVKEDFDHSTIYDGSSLTDLKIKDIPNKDNITFDSFLIDRPEYKLVEQASKGDYGVYTKEVYNKGIDLMIYNPSRYNTAFYMEYVVKDVVVVHDDVAELYWNLLGDEYEEDITDFQAVVHLPSQDPDFRVWLHGPLNGLVNRNLEEASAKATFYDLDAYEPVTIRMMFDKNLVPNATKKSNVLGRDIILEIEQAYADEANAKREEERQRAIKEATNYTEHVENTLELADYNQAYRIVMKLEPGIVQDELLSRLKVARDKIEVKLVDEIEKQITLVKKEPYKENLTDLKIQIDHLLEGEQKEQYRAIYGELTNFVEEFYHNKRVETSIYFIITIIAILLFHIYFYYQYDLKLPCDFNQKYYRDFPADYSPAVIEYVMKKKVTNKSFSAIILELIRKKWITFTRKPNGKLDDYIFQKQESKEPISISERKVLDLLFDVISPNKETVKLSQIKNFGKTHSNALEFLEAYNDFEYEATQEGKKQNIYISRTGYKIASYILSTVIFLFFFRCSLVYENPYLGLATFIFTLVNVLWTIFKKFRTIHGKRHYTMWKAHKNFLKDFGRFDEKELPEVALWERYLVTATVLGCAKQVQKRLNLQLAKIQNNATGNTNDTVIGDIVYMSMLNDIITSNMTQVLAKTTTRAIQTSYSNSGSSSSSSHSSGGGFGGGSVGGGGFGGGGGGGGRF